MRFKGLDLNLLVALDVLLETRSVSGAAKRMNLSQPAMSAALSRLREYFGDDLLVASGKRMYPTAYAESLAPVLKDCLRDLDVLVSSPNAFDPATAQRTFLVVGSDYATAAVLAPLVIRLAERAPGIRIEISSPGDDSNARLGEGKVDILITPDSFAHPDHPAELLYEERHVVVGWSGNPIFEREITEADVFAAGHVAVSLGGERKASFADRALALMGKVRRIEVAAASFTSVPWLLRDTQRLTLMHERLARSMAEFFPIAYVSPPFEFPIMRQVMQHHKARTHDKGLGWLRQELMAVAAIDQQD